MNKLTYSHIDISLYSLAHWINLWLSQINFKYIHMAIDAKLMIFIINFLLKDNCFTEFCCFLSNLNMNQPAVQLVHSFSQVQLFAAPWTQHTRPLCPSPTPGVHPNSCPSSRWCHPAISSSIVPFSSCPQYLPASGSFPMSQLFSWGGQSTGVSALAPVLPMNTQDWSYLGWIGWISLQFKGFSSIFSNTTVQKHQFFDAHLSSQSNSHIHTWPLEKP